jgi:glycerol-1-phosphate dehydrogenase [NAD(P)+]
VTQATLRKVIEKALAEASDTRSLTLARDALRSTDEAFASCFGRRPAVVVADEITFEIAGRTVDATLRASGRAVCDPLILPTRPLLHADLRHVLEIRDVLRTHDGIPVAVGAGTINDLVKLAAHHCDRPYLVVATAASMDGYAAFGAAITKDGVKQTMACPAPTAIVADLDVLASAPPSMTASGYGDLLGKVTAGADWIIADTLGVEPIIPAVWEMVQSPLRDALARPERLAAGDHQAIERFFLGLIMSGLAMQAAHSSRPASGSEHQFSHLWEMNGLSHRGSPVSHGFKVGVGTLAMTALYERLLARDLTQLEVASIRSRRPSADDLQERVRRTHSNQALIETAIQETRAKHVTPEQLGERLKLVRERWPELRQRLEAQLIPSVELRHLLDAAGCPSHPADIGLSPTQLRDSYEAARQIRRRYTVLDLAAETGLLDSCVQELIESAEFWRQSESDTMVGGH